MNILEDEVSPPLHQPRIVVAGAGSIGCFVGGMLAAARHHVTLLVRPRVGAKIQAHGLALTDLDGLSQQVNPDDLYLAEDPSCLAHADIVLVTVKSRDTAAMAALIEAHAPPDVQVISLQNGITNAATLRQSLPVRDVRAGMVPFNVVPTGESGYHRATDGDIVIEAGAGALGAFLNVPGLAVSESRDIENIQWGKFLLNLNNALNALSGLPLKAQLSDRAWRKLMADQWDEAMRVITAQGGKPVSSTPVSVNTIPRILRLPSFIFKRVASKMVKIDPQARASMSYDLMDGRPTEIDVLQGEIVRLGASLGVPTPINATVADVLRTAEEAGEGLPNLTAAALRSEIAQAARMTTSGL